MDVQFSQPVQRRLLFFLCRSTFQNQNTTIQIYPSASKFLLKNENMSELKKRKHENPRCLSKNKRLSIRLRTLRGQLILTVSFIAVKIF